MRYIPKVFYSNIGEIVTVRRRSVLYVVSVLLIGVGLIPQPARAQAAVPREAPNTWRFEQNHVFQVVTFLPDGTYFMYQSQHQYDQQSNRTRQQEFGVRGSAAFDRSVNPTAVTLTQCSSTGSTLVRQPEAGTPAALSDSTPCAMPTLPFSFISTT